ncbi:hypothetical protein BpHYR1_019072 [Brachionus plicatilis]|uniref:Uncharacterized protein n=1 Tax=Brachionus plicatilis TaxID=10195 RepID=A0A3M7SF59_BRAPC|nr:hypothetical protein BpHYR1_019072 [Brachionus plicatilis]
MLEYFLVLVFGTDYLPNLSNVWSKLKSSIKSSLPKEQIRIKMHENNNQFNDFLSRERHGILVDIWSIE